MNQRPGLDTMLKDAQSQEVVIAWAIDRLSRSFIDLLRTIQDREAVGVALYPDQQHLDTTTPTGNSLARDGRLLRVRAHISGRVPSRS